MAGVAGICIGIVLLTGLAVFIYYLIYTHNINQKIKSGGISGRKLIDIPKAIMITVIVVLVLFCGILSHSLQSAYHDTERDTRNHYAVINVSDPQNYEYISYFGSTELDDASFAKVYSIDQNPGYTPRHDSFRPVLQIPETDRWPPNQNGRCPQSHRRPEPHDRPYILWWNEPKYPPQIQKAGRG